MKTLRRSAVALIVACALLSARPALAEVKSSAISRGQYMVEGHQKTIALFMHPTATLRSIEYQSCTDLADGTFQLEYTFRFKAWYGCSFYSNMRFTCFGNGSLDCVSPGARNAWVPPFCASDFVMRYVKDRIVSDADVQSNPELARQLADFDAQRMLEWWLKAGGL